MVMLWIGIGLGIMLISAMIIKYTRTPKYDCVRIDLHCKSCGDVTNGLKCPKCETRKVSKRY